MGETLFIRVGSQEKCTIPWLITTNGTNEIIASGELNDAQALVELSDKARTREVIVFVPACDIAIKSLKVPGSSKRAIRLAAPYMVEDELAQDVDELFFAYSTVKPNQQGQNCFLAAVAREQLQLWQSWLAQANINCKVMIPDALAMPHSEQECHAIVLGEQLIVRNGLWQAMTIEHNTWPIVAKSLFNEETSLQKIKAYSNLPTAEHSVEVEYMPEELPLALLAEHMSVKFNLLQGEFQVKEKHSPVISQWLWVAGIAAVALLLNFGIKGAQLLTLSNQQSAIEQEIIDSYKKAFPKTKRVRISTIRSQLKQKLNDIGSEGSSNDFLQLLVKLEPALASVPQIKPETLKYDGKRNEIRMQTTAKDFQYFEKLKTAFENAGLSVTQGAQNNQGDLISGSFSIKDKEGKR
jgi:general secretion pathway protein L